MGGRWREQDGYNVGRHSGDCCSGKPETAVVIITLKAGIAHRSDISRKRTGNDHRTVFIGADSDFEIGYVLIHVNGELASVVVGIHDYIAGAVAQCLGEQRRRP